MSPSLLIVDSCPGSGAGMAEMFRRHGWQVELTGTLVEALDRLAIGPPPDAALVDLMLPDGDGEYLVRAIRREGAATRVVVHTAPDVELRLRVVRDLGASAVLIRPAGFPELRDALVGVSDAASTRDRRAAS